MVGASDRTGSVEFAGRRLCWRSLGEGPALMLVNGYAATAADWDPTLLSALARSFRLICPDNRGMGGADLGEPGDVSIEAMAADLQALLDEVGLERTFLAGWSMGGFIAQRLALMAPQRIEAMVLLSTDPGGSSATRADSAVWAKLTDRSGSPREQATRLISLLFPADVAPEIDRRFGELVAQARASLSPAALEAQEKAMAAWHGTEQPPPPAGSPPVLVLHGEEDVVIPADNAAALADRWSAARVERYVGGGHAFIAQEPERLADSLRSFLSRGR